jgi:hypothetical protein
MSQKNYKISINGAVALAMALAMVFENFICIFYFS